MADLELDVSLEVDGISGGGIEGGVKEVGLALLKLRTDGILEDNHCSGAGEGKGVLTIGLTMLRFGGKAGSSI